MEGIDGEDRARGKCGDDEEGGGEGCGGGEGFLRAFGGAYRWLALKGCSWVRRELIDQRLENVTPKKSLIDQAVAALAIYEQENSLLFWGTYTVLKSPVHKRTRSDGSPIEVSGKARLVEKSDELN